MAILRKRNGALESFTLAVRPRDPARETWDGPRAGLEGAGRVYGADAAVSMADEHAVRQMLERSADGAPALYFSDGWSAVRGASVD